ncbi:hypothetical protein DRF60_14455 [Chryseobacterium elymi]|uniref:Uncharacterized protein n=1 Tax=Chryseobacterium elymi TaxID=395936 RepID=A0A3D9DDJ3_9FLAO|nr:hypothetical protein [Chryseobacterium elymi]REC76082.1 hypothetical protein DRF60_14455 [Chryseobacterium elymi]
MKQLLYILIFYASNLFCQDLPEGIGPYKIDKLTIKQFDSITKSQNLKLIECVGMNCLYSNLNKPNVYVKVIPNTKEVSDNSYPTYYLDNVTTYNIKNLKINNKYTIGFANLIFVDNILSFIHFSDVTGYLSMDFETKYGLGELSKTERDDYCYINRERISFTKKNYYRTYTNGNIEINRVISDGKDDNCDQKTSLYFIAENLETIKKIKTENKAKEEFFKNIENNKKRDELKDL